MAKLIRTCLCGTEFEATRLNNIYCSQRCSWLYQKRKRRGLVAAQGKHRPKLSREDVQRNAVFRRLYGIDLATYNRMHAEQEGLCAICGQPETRKDPRWDKTFRLAVDHDHKTGRVRQLLCRRCNHAIGLMDDSTERLASAIAYLCRHAPKPARHPAALPIGAYLEQSQATP